MSKAPTQKPRRPAAAPVRFETVTLAGLGIGLPLLTLILIVLHGVDDRGRGDLKYHGAVDLIAEIMETNGPGVIATPVTASIAIGSDSITLDTLVAGDSMSIPSLRKGGFLQDQIERHNVQQLSRVIYSHFFRDETSPLELPASLLRVTKSDGGREALSGRLNPGVLAIPSPFSQDRWRSVVTADHTSRPSFVGTGSLIALAEEPDGTSSGSLFPGRDCTIKAASQRRYLLYCFSQAGLPVNRGYDLGITFQDEERRWGAIQISSEADRSVWVNGTRVTLPAVANAQDIVHQDRVGSFIVSTSAVGVLAAEQWINGRSRVSIPRGRTINSFGRAGRNATVQSTEQPLILSLRAGFSEDLEAELRKLVTATESELVDASGVVASLGSGEVLAITQVRPPDPAPIRAFEPLLVGSMIKPVLASAILARRPDLVDLRVENQSSVRRVYGVDLRRPFSGFGGCRGYSIIDFSTFLSCSSNLYAAELVFRAVLDSPEDVRATRSGVIPLVALENSELSNGLFSLFRDANPVRRAVEGRSDAVWTSTSSEDMLQPPPADLTLHPWESRPWFIDPMAPGLSPDLLARYAFGGWDNRWTLIGVVEAYARIATSREVELTLVRRLDSQGVFPPVGAEGDLAFRAVRTGLGQVGESGTARGLTRMIRSALGDSVAVLLKTGTLNEPEVKLKTVAFAIGRPTSSESHAPLRCGLVGTFRFDFSEDRSGSLTNPNLDFVEGGLLEVLKDHWQQTAGCP